MLPSPGLFQEEVDFSEVSYYNLLEGNASVKAHGFAASATISPIIHTVIDFAE